ncbi:psychosine receptor-like [Myxocyprinus asiaticus]|uniref:psychosine receptor-like n=1 Tax=Myxocyprinus asiaticus TaxID=70543 RepID=UPI0022222C92|nr:psychosine receptor-like [Myxocyprinus asiaticus]
MNVTVEWTTNSNMNDSADCYPSEHPEKKFFIALHLAVILIGTPSNIFFLYVSCQHIRQKNELGVYLFNLALSDLLFIMCLPMWIQFTLYDKWLYSKNVCIACVFLLFTNFYSSAILLSCIAVDRYFAVVHPLKFCAFRKRRTAVAISIATWIFIIIFNATTVMSSRIYDVENFICLEIFPLPETQRWVNIARFVVGFFVPAVVVGFCSWRIYLDVRRNQAIGLMERRRVFKLLGSLLLTLYLCFGPVHIMMVLRVFLEQCPYPNWLFISYKLCVMLSTLNCLADPLLYCFTSRTGQASASNALLVLRRMWKKENQAKMVMQNDQILGTAEC